MSKTEVPVLILGYLRFDGILRLIKSCSEAGVREIYLSIDGVKNNSDRIIQNLGLETIHRYAQASELKVYVRRRKSNVGLAVAVIEGISWFFSEVDFGIILEDDLIVSQSFFDFVISAKELCHESPQIVVISGNSYNSARTHQVSATHYPLIWGWATWAIEWEKFILSLENPIHFGIKLPISSSLFWLSAALQSRYGYVDSWAMSFAQYSFSRNRLCLLPPVNLVTNRGADSVAIHSSSLDAFVGFPVQAIPRSIDWNLPNERDIRLEDRLLERYLYSIKLRHVFSPLKLLFMKLRQPRNLNLRDRIRLAKNDLSIEVIDWES